MKAYLKIENEDGSFREYKKDRIKARWVKEGFKFAKRLEDLERKGDMAAVLDARLRFTCDFFGDKELTPDAILDGMDADALIPTLDRIFKAVLGTGDGEGTASGNQ